MNSRRLQFLLLVSLVGFCAANVSGMYVIPYGFDSVYKPYSDSTAWTPPETATTTPEPPTTAPPTTQPPSSTTPSTPVPSTSTVPAPLSSSHRICTKCMKKTSTTVPPTSTQTPKTTPSTTVKPTTTTTTTTTKKPTTTTTTTTTTKRPTTTKNPTTTSTSTTTTSTTTTTTTTTPRPTSTHRPKKSDDAYTIKYYHQYNYYYPNEAPVIVNKPSKPTKIQASVYIKNVTKAVVPIAENIYMTDSCEVDRLPHPPKTEAPPPPPPVKPHVPLRPVRPHLPPFPTRPHVPSYMSYLPPPSPPQDYAHTSGVADSLEEVYPPHPQPEPAQPQWHNPRQPPIHQGNSINAIQKDILSYLSDPNIWAQAYPHDPEARGFPVNPLLPPQNYNYNSYSQFLEPGKSWLSCPFSGHQMSNSPTFYSLTT